MARSHAATVQTINGLIIKQAELMSRSSSSADPAERDRKQTDSAELDRLISVMKELNVMNREVIVPMLQLIENYDVDQKIAERAYRPDLMEKYLKIEADIDKRIEKALGRLVTIKEYKKFYGTQEDKEPLTDVIDLRAKRLR